MAKPMTMSLDPAAVAAFDRALRRYAALTRKTCAEIVKKKLRDVLIKARAAMPATPPDEMPNFSDGSVDSCKLVAWRIMQRRGRTVAQNKRGQWLSYVQRMRTNKAGERVKAGRRDTDILRRRSRAYSREYARAYAAKMTRARWNHARFSRYLFTAAMRGIAVAGRAHGPASASVLHKHTYKASLTAALKPRDPSARAWQRVIDRAISAGLRASAADMEAYLRRQLGILAGRARLS